MFLKKKETFSVTKFWQEYEESIGEKVLAKSLGQYISGWAEYTQTLWGLAIATSAGFRFHHFPHEGWLMALSRITSGGEGPKEKKFFIPKESINSIELITEKRRWKKILFPCNPVLVIQCSINGIETSIVIEADNNAAAVAEALK
ncbi:MAG: hypothetical protein LBH07_08650 [Treponema sp.]|jgi:hypothetical protein|nr:hypothetical protein [Treponema sp.]